MAKVREHTLRIGDIYMYAQGVSIPLLFQSRLPVNIPIQNGPEKWYYGTLRLRQFTCTVTLYGTHEKTRAQLKSFSNKVVPFVSEYIGAFNAMVEIKGNVIDGTPNMLKAELTVQEVV